MTSTTPIDDERQVIVVAPHLEADMRAIMGETARVIARPSLIPTEIPVSQPQTVHDRRAKIAAKRLRAIRARTYLPLLSDKERKGLRWLQRQIRRAQIELALRDRGREQQAKVAHRKEVCRLMRGMAELERETSGGVMIQTESALDVMRQALQRNFIRSRHGALTHGL